MSLNLLPNKMLVTAFLFGQIEFLNSECIFSRRKLLPLASQIKLDASTPSEPAIAPKFL